MKQKTGRSFVNAFSGLIYFFRHESNGRIQTVVGICTLLLAGWFHIKASEWIVILICIGLVLSLEMLNSALEKLCDLVQPDFHPRIKIIKDVAAGAVLWISLISAAIGAIIFLPEIGKYL
ncbi:MAG: diacylglycerol kinase family protein [Bacteroidota bacterium]|nr:diacylglycerol kinase family protein [Bacteroidota bacterium]